jgi:hypothetical protein
MSSISSAAGRLPLAIGLGLIVCLPGTVVAADNQVNLEAWLDKAGALVRTPGDCRDVKRVEALEEACRTLDTWGARLVALPPDAASDEALRRLERLLSCKAGVDRYRGQLFALRTEFAKEAAGEARWLALSQYLRVMNVVTDLSGRLRFQLEEAASDAAYRVAASPPLRDQLIDMLARYDSSAGAEVMAWVLFDPPANAPNGAKPASVATKQRVLQLIGKTGSFQVTPLLARLIREERRYPQLVIAAADVLRRVGFPQDPRPGEKDEVARPPITAAQLLPILRELPRQSLTAESSRLRDELVQWLEVRSERGLEGDSYALATYTVRPGDWVLLRNPSPYNRVTEMSPGLFTHVGVVTTEKGSDGRQRLVIADLTTDGTHIRVSNVDVLIREYRHFLFLRHADAATARTMADVAGSILGNEAAFDFNYRIENVIALKGQSKEGKLIKSYCAGLLLLCGQETQVERSKLFPFEEHVRGGKMAKNLEEIGISFGARFVSPTGPLFSTEFKIVGQREPVYDPANEIEQAIYDRFAECLVKYDLLNRWDSVQNLRLTLATAAKDNPGLARLLAQMNNVNPAMDLVSAAKAAAVHENLEATGKGKSKEFLEAFTALTSGAADDLRREGYTDKQIAQYLDLRRQHADLYRQFREDKIDLQALRKALVAHYATTGKAEIEKRFKISSKETDR